MQIKILYIFSSSKSSKDYLKNPALMSMQKAYSARKSDKYLIPLNLLETRKTVVSRDPH